MEQKTNLLQNTFMIYEMVLDSSFLDFIFCDVFLKEHSVSINLLLRYNIFHIMRIYTVHLNI